MEFTATGHGSDRYFLFRSKSMLKGSGLYITESLTPRRQAMFSELLRLRREGMIHSVFTRSGVILVRRSRNSAPIWIGSPEAVRQLSAVAVADGPIPGRARGPDSGVLPESTPVSGVHGHAQRAGAISSPDVGGSMEMEVPSGANLSDLLQHGSCSVDLADAESALGRERPVSTLSSLLDCAREAVQLVHLPPPLEGTPIRGATADRPAGGVDPAEERDWSPGAIVTEDGSTSLSVRTVVTRPPNTGDSGETLLGTSGIIPPSAATPLPERAAAQRENPVSDRSSAPPPEGCGERSTGSPSARGGAGHGVSQRGFSMVVHYVR